METSLISGIASRQTPLDGVIYISNIIKPDYFCCTDKNSRSTWPRLQIRILEEMCKFPSGHTLSTHNIANWEEGKGCLAEVCLDCHKPIFKIEMILGGIHARLAKLTATI
jgi:hypothetical protein